MWPRNPRVPLTAALCAVGAACANNPAPGGWLPEHREVAQDPYGAWVQIRRSDRTELGGEFIALHGDTLFVLTESGRLTALHSREFDQARLAYFNSSAGLLGLWTGIGALSTISHGGFLIITLPMWIIGGSVASGSESRAPLEGVRRWSEWSELRMYARFPQGIPESLDRRVLRPRPRRSGDD